MSRNAMRRQANTLHESQQQTNEYFVFNPLINNSGNSNRSSFVAHHINNINNNNSPDERSPPPSSQNLMQASTIVTSNPVAASRPTNPKHRQQQRSETVPTSDTSPKISKLDSIINRLKTNKTSTTDGVLLTQTTPTTSPQSIIKPAATQQNALLSAPHAQQVATVTNSMPVTRNNRIINNQATQTLVTTGTLTMNPGSLTIKPDQLNSLKSSANNHTLDLASLLTTIIGKGKSSKTSASGGSANPPDSLPNLFVNDELFKQQLQRIDSEIRLIAAHSKNKLYSLNGFSSSDSRGSGPSKPSDLPPRLPPPPPWIPKSALNSSILNKTKDISKRAGNFKINLASSSTESTAKNYQASNYPGRQSHAQSLLVRNEVKRITPPVNASATIQSKNHANIIINKLSSNQVVSKIRVAPSNINNVTITYTNRQSPYQKSHPRPSIPHHQQYSSSIVRAYTNNKQQQFVARQLSNSSHNISSSVVKVVIPPIKFKNLNNSQNSCPEEESLKTDDDLREEYETLSKQLQAFQELTCISFKESSATMSQQQFTHYRISNPDRSIRDSSSSPNENVVQPASQSPVRDRIDQRPKIHIPTFKIYRDGIVPMPSKQKQDPIMPATFGLQLNNYTDRERPQPGNDSMNVDQYANCLNLVRRLDFEREKEFKEQNHIPKFRMPIGERPLRLRRLRGDQFNVPASASYKATRRIGLK